MVFLQKQLFLHSILLCIKKLYKSILVATFVVGIKNFAAQDYTYEKWVLSRPGQAEYVSALKEVTGMDKCSQNPRKFLRSSEIKKIRDLCSESKRYSYGRVHKSVFKRKWAKQSFITLHLEPILLTT